LWLFTSEGFYSVISAESNDEFQDALCARARRRKDLVRLKKALGAGAGLIRSTPRRDYPFRMDVDRERLADHVRHELASIRYSNFKDQVEKTQGREAHDKYLAVWRAAIGLEQKGRHGLYGDGPRHSRKPDFSVPRPR
jgi:hypothetical protein